MKKALDDKTVLVTGASRGIGRQLAARFGKEGARLALTGRHEITLDRTCEELRREGCEVLGLIADVADPIKAPQVVEDVESQLGPIDILVNNAGVFGVDGPFMTNDLDAWLKTMEVNLRGPHAVHPGSARWHG